ncbi:MraY family glycosyltransferase [uncultured Thiocystis sp.]|uniref:glycosyltransferase family 4 protein n=1 Tax=uncultured Thiocystis sp. TaxID=1202134 RepID=UPI0025E3A074|nr:MraY family glycosyltransferase [uncultured Thiocystis sp.]
MQAIYVLVLALFISMLLVPPLARYAALLGLVDQPGERKIHHAIIPRTGGIAIVIGSLASILLWVPMRQDLVAFLVAVGLLFAFGVLDDRFNLHYRIKLLGQVLAALILTLGGGVLIQDIPFFGDGLLVYPLELPLTIFVLVGITNAVNLSDGLDGLAGGVSLLALGGLSVLAYQCGDTAALMVAFAIMGATFGFLRFNTNPAQIFMGDTGSQFLGFATGALALIVTQREDSAVSRLIPILILGVPILDTLTVMIRRIADGRSPFSPDRLHLHHRLLSAGLNQPKAVVLVYSAQAFLILLAYLLRYSADTVVLGAYVLFCLAALGGIGFLCRREARMSPLHLEPERQDLISDSLLIAIRNKLLVRAPYLILTLAIPLILVLGAFAAPAIGLDIALLASLLFVGLLLSVRLPSTITTWIERLSANVTAVAVVYFVAESLDGSHSNLVLGLFFAIGVLTALWIRFSAVSFRASPLDLLILLIAFVVPTLSNERFEQIGFVALQCIILFYAIEVLIAERKHPWDPLRIGVMTALGVLLVKGLARL